jgi:hypothetical protein
MAEVKLVTKAEWDGMDPFVQGYVVYMQGDLPGSELKRLRNPYQEGTNNHIKYNNGQAHAVLIAQDSEE